MCECCICICMFVYMWGACICVLVHVEVRDWQQVSFSISFLIYVDMCVHFFSILFWSTYCKASSCLIINSLAAYEWLSSCFIFYWYHHFKEMAPFTWFHNSNKVGMLSEWPTFVFPGYLGLGLNFHLLSQVGSLVYFSYTLRKSEVVLKVSNIY